MKIAKAKERLRGKQPKLKPNQAKHLLELHDLGTYTQAELAELFGVGRSTIYRTLERMRPAPPEPERPFPHLANPQTTGRDYPYQTVRRSAQRVRGRLGPGLRSVDERQTRIVSTS